MQRKFSHIIFPNNDEHYACLACATLVVEHDAGAICEPAHKGPCTLNFDCCTDKAWDDCYDGTLMKGGY